MSLTYCIVSGGKVYPEELEQVRQLQNVIWIAADSGAEALLEQNLFPDILVGDLDSISPLSLSKIEKARKTEIFRFPAEKDFSDTYLALKAITILCHFGFSGLQQEWKKYYQPLEVSSSPMKQIFCPLQMEVKSAAAFQEHSEKPNVEILGAIGSRIDHSLSNLWIAFEFIRELNLTYRGRDNIIVPMQGESLLSFQYNSQFPFLSILPFSESLVELSLDGFLYSLEKATISQEKASLLLSNEVVRDGATISLKKGRCLIIRSKDR